MGARRRQTPCSPMRSNDPPRGREAASRSEPAEPALTASCQVDALDYFRVPYTVVESPQTRGVDWVRSGQGGPALLWPADTGPGHPAAATISASGEGIPIFARLVPGHPADLVSNSAGWEHLHSIVDRDGGELASVWLGSDGSIYLPFAPDEVLGDYQTERYSSYLTGDFNRRVKRAAMFAYYRMRPLMPRPAQIWFRQRFTRIQQRARFPRWPSEPALADFFDLLFAMLARVCGSAVPRIAAWPGDHQWALVLTHDVEQAEGYAAVDGILELERGHGLRSCWYYVPRRYPIDPADLHALQARGLEVGVHGLYHDGRDIAQLGERLPAIRAAAEAWGASGFRAPALHREWALMPRLGFDYDSSFPDTDPYEPMPGGCCSWLPFFIDDLVELPVTMPQDHTLFVILKQQDGSVWIEKAELLRRRGGMALIDTHPDYLVEEPIRRAYEQFLDRFAADATAWHALPQEVSEWWRRRAASHLEYADGGWRIVGPAASDGRVEFVEATSASETAPAEAGRR